MSTSVIPDLELEDTFKGTDFGGADHRKLLETSVLKKAMGYHCGHTITTIMQDVKRSFINPSMEQHRNNWHCIVTMGSVG